MKDMTCHQLLKEGETLRTERDLEGSVNDIIYFVRHRLKLRHGATMYCTIQNCYNYLELDDDDVVTTNFVCPDHINEGYSTKKNVQRDVMMDVYQNDILVFSYDYFDYLRKGKAE